MRLLIAFTKAVLLLATLSMAGLAAYRLLEYIVKNVKDPSYIAIGIGAIIVLTLFTAEFYLKDEEGFQAVDRRRRESDAAYRAMQANLAELERLKGLTSTIADKVKKGDL